MCRIGGKMDVPHDLQHLHTWIGPQFQGWLGFGQGMSRYRSRKQFQDFGLDSSFRVPGFGQSFRASLHNTGHVNKEGGLDHHLSVGLLLQRDVPTWYQTAL